MTNEIRSDGAKLTAIVGWMSDEYRAAVVRRVLAWSKQANAEAIKSFNKALRKTVKIKGFKNPHKASSNALQGEVVQKIATSPQLLGSVLNVWMESQSELFDTVSAHLSESGIQSQGLAPGDRRFKGKWTEERWMKERDELAASHVELSADDVALMLCCVSGLLPVSEVASSEAPVSDVPAPVLPFPVVPVPDVPVSEVASSEAPVSDVPSSDVPVSEAPVFDVPSSEAPVPDVPSSDVDESGAQQETHEESIFSRFLEELQATSSEAPLWDEAPAFVKTMTRIIEKKEAEKRLVAPFRAAIAELKEQFAKEFVFFQTDLDAIQVASEEIAVRMPMLERLSTLLTEYRPLHQTASDIQEELRIGPVRQRLQRDILETIRRVERLRSVDSGSDGARRNAGGGETPSPSEPSPAASDHQGNEDQFDPNGQNGSMRLDEQQVSQPQQHGEPDEDSAGAVLVVDKPIYGVDAGRSIGDKKMGGDGNSVVHAHPAFTEEDLVSLKSENKGLKSELYKRKKSEETLRTSLKDARTQLARRGEEEFLSIANVGNAVELAKAKFADKLLFKPNSKSEISDNPYEKPREVWFALQWLATQYHGSRMGKGKHSNFDRSLRKTCRWTYKSHQSQTTLGKFKEWYTTSIEGNIYSLKEHIGKGSSKDARYTIRIGFDWDSERQLVVIGYIGQHPRTTAT